MEDERGFGHEVVVSFTALALVGAGIAFVVSLAHASPVGQRAAEPLEPAQVLASPLPNLSRASSSRVHASTIRRRPSTRVSWRRLPALSRVRDWRTLGFQWPVAGRGEITSPFGPRDGGFHHGADIGCGIGQRLYSARAGRVIGVGDAGPGYGLAILIDHGSSYQTVYAHLSKLEVQPGQFVRTRQEIGLCGETGNASGPHVHFEMRYGGYVWDPVRFLP